MNLLPGQEGDIPIPITNTFLDAHGPPHGDGHDHSSNEPPTCLPAAGTEEYHRRYATAVTKKGLGVKHRECLKNHAAAIGGNATDGCGEFMPGGEEGSLEALKCSSCSCHWSFHRKEADGESSCCDCHQSLKCRRLLSHGGGLLLSGAPLQLTMPLGALQSSDSDEMVVARSPFVVKKRFRTKFTAEQKERMLGFAKKVGWLLQKGEESAVQRLCQEIGVTRRVLKVWMYNNKHSLAKKSSSLQFE